MASDLPDTVRYPVCAVVCVGGAYLVWQATRKVLSASQESPTIQRYLWSVLLDRHRQLVNGKVRVNVQRKLQKQVVGVRGGHPHEVAAMLRNTATESMHQCAAKIGCTSYVVSPSARESDHVGFRAYYQCNDLAQHAKFDKITGDSCIIMTDIDYYVDWAMWASFTRPVLMYTYVPTHLGGKVEDGIVSVKDNVFTTRINGGGCYEHELWDYSNDSAWVVTTTGGWLRRFIGAVGKALGLWRGLDVVVMSIDHFHVGRDRRIVAMVPFAVMPSIFNQDPRSELKRLKVSCEKGYSIMRFMDGSEPKISVCKDGIPASATMSEELFHGTCIRYDGLTTKFLSDVHRFAKKELDENGSAILSDFLKNTSHRGVIAHIPAPGTFAAHFQCDGSNILEDGKRYARRFASAPLSEEAVYPAECENNEVMCLEKRLNIPQRRAKSLMTANSGVRKKGEPPSRFGSYAVEFVKLVVPVPFMGVPISIDDVAIAQNKPMQRLRSGKRIMDTDEKFVVSSFQKREAYNGPNDPRNISSVPTMHTLKLSSYTMAMKKDCLLDIGWYAPARSPVEIASAIQDLALENSMLVEGDYSRFDGTQTRWIRENVEHAAYLRWVCVKHRDDLSTLLRDEFDAKAYTKTGIFYTPGCSRLSGSPLTTDGNTLINAFVTYATLRELGFDSRWSFEKAGLFYGDDSLMTGAVSQGPKGLSTLVRVAGTVGLELKAEVRGAHTPISFLSRIFPDAWATPDSYASPMRALLKIHTTANAVDDIKLCGYQKATAYLVTDPNTPLISHWCRAYIKALGQTLTGDVADPDLPYWYLVKEYRQSPWPQDSIANMTAAVAEDLGVTERELLDHIAKIEAHTGDVASIPCLLVAAGSVKVDCVVDGLVCRTGGPSDNDLQSQEDNGDNNSSSARRDHDPTNANNVGTIRNGSVGNISKSGACSDDGCGKQGCSTVFKSNDQCVRRDGADEKSTVPNFHKHRSNGEFTTNGLSRPSNSGDSSGHPRHDASTQRDRKSVV